MAHLERNEQAVLHLLLEEPNGLPVKEIVEKLRLSRPTVVKILAVLVDQGRVEKHTSAGPNPGRPVSIFTIVPPDGVVLGIDVGHCHVRVGVASLDGEMLRVADDPKFDVERE